MREDNNRKEEAIDSPQIPHKGGGGHQTSPATLQEPHLGNNNTIKKEVEEKKTELNQNYSHGKAFVKQWQRGP